MEEERLLTKVEVCHRLGISKWTAVNLAKKGILRTMSISDRGDRRYYLSSVLKFMHGGDNGHKEETKVKIETIEDAVIYVIETYRFKGSSQGLMDVINIVEKEYGFVNKDIFNKTHEMLEKKVISFISHGKNAGLIINKGGETNG